MKSSIIKKQIFVAIAFLVIGVIVLSGATYAWFALNSDVSASGIKIQAETEGVTFEITATTTTEAGTGKPIPDWTNATGNTSASVDLTGIDAKLYPTTPVINDGSDGRDAYSFAAPAVWYHAFSDKYDVAVSNSTQVALTSATVTDKLLNVSSGDNAGNYALVATYYIRLNPSTSGDVKLTNVHVNNVSIAYDSSATDPDADLIKSVRVLVVGDNNATKLGSTTTGDSTVLVSEVKNNGEAHQINIYAFYDGTDANCKSSAFDPDKINISVRLAGTIVETTP